MNSEEAGLLWSRKHDIELAGGEAAHRQHALQHLKLKTVIKESHCSPVHQLSFNYADDHMHNIFATVGDEQATIYDDLHMGDFVAVVVSFTNHKTEHADGGAVAGADCNISLISVVEAQVIGLLTGHQKAVIDLSACPCKPDLLVSLSKDGNVRVWDTAQGVCKSCYSTEATCLAVSPDGQSFVTGGKKGAMHIYQEPAVRDRLDMECSTSGRHTETLDCILFLGQDRLASRSIDGRMCVWSMSANKQLSTWKGNTTGDVYVYDTSDGRRMTHVAPIKVSAPVKACGISPDCRHLLAAVGNGFIFRFEYRKRDTEAAAGDKEDIDDGMLDDNDD